MVVASGTAEGEPHEDRRRGLHAIDDILDGILFGNDSAFAVAAMIAVETRGDLLIERGTWKHVAGNLLQGELVERQVAVERVDHPVAPPPHVSLGVGLIAVGVGIARGIEPVRRHPFSISRRRQQAIDDFLVGVGRVVVQERVDFGRRRRQAGQVQAHATDERGAVGFRSGDVALLLEPIQNEEINLISRPCRVSESGSARARGAMKDQWFSHLAPCSIHR